MNKYLVESGISKTEYVAVAEYMNFVGQYSMFGPDWPGFVDMTCLLLYFTDAQCFDLRNIPQFSMNEPYGFQEGCTKVAHNLFQNGYETRFQEYASNYNLGFTTQAYVDVA